MKKFLAALLMCSFVFTALAITTGCSEEKKKEEKKEEKKKDS